MVAGTGAVATAHPLASLAGVEMLKMGGNAVDAAVAAAFAIGVAEPSCSGIGGGGFMLIRMNQTAEVTFIDFREVAPQKATADMYPMEGNSVIGDANETGHLAVAVPGDVAGLCLALQSFGRLTLTDVVAPAVRYAEEGVPITQSLRRSCEAQRERLGTFSEFSKIYLRNALFASTGGILQNPDYARTLRLIAEEGAGVFYEGEIATAIAAEIRCNGGVLTEDDLAAYRPSIRTPVTGSYRGYDIVSTSLPSCGGIHVVEILNMLESLDAKALGHNTAEHLHLLAEIQKRVFADRDKYMGDPGFVDVPSEGLTSKAYAAERVREINFSRATKFAGIKPGRPVVHEASSTTHLSTMDRELNMVSLTQTIGRFFGCGVVVPGYGFVLNDEMHDMDPRPGGPNSIAPGKKPLSSISPTLVVKDGLPHMTVGSPGSRRIITAVSQVISNVIDHGMGIQDAIEAARVHAEGDQLHIEGRVPRETVQRLICMGHNVTLGKEYDMFFGGAQGVIFDSVQGVFRGGADPRRDGMAVGFNG
ncbi:MAG: gamma-glutamyltransferase [Bacillota bacterium]|nr:gamma-glutamyltransferase [Bacillota bacterium]